MQNEPLLRPDQAMRRLSCSRSMIYKLIKNGKLEAIKNGSSWRIYPESLKNYIKNSHIEHMSHS